MRVYTSLTLIAALSGTPGCTDDVCEQLGDTASIEIGRRRGPEGEFIELRTGDVVLLELGPTGLWGMSLNVRMRGVLSPAASPVGPVDRDVSRWDERERDGRPGLLEVRAVSGDAEVGSSVQPRWHGEVVFVLIPFNEQPPEALVGEQLTLQAEVSDGCGNVAYHEVDVVLQ